MKSNLDNTPIEIEVEPFTETALSFGCYVDTNATNDEGKSLFAGREVFFPKSKCAMRKEDRTGLLTDSYKYRAFFLTCPKWLLEIEGVKFKSPEANSF